MKIDGRQITFVAAEVTRRTRTNSGETWLAKENIQHSTFNSQRPSFETSTFDVECSKVNVFSVRRIHHHHSGAGFTLLEILTYLAMLTIVLGVAIMSFHQCWDNSSHLRRNADDIVRALDAGDRWRADIRSATGQIQLTEAHGAEELKIPSSSGEIVYAFANGELRRQSAGPPTNVRMLANVQSSQMESDPRGSVSAWRWELELKS